MGNNRLTTEQLIEECLENIEILQLRIQCGDSVLPVMDRVDLEINIIALAALHERQKAAAVDSNQATVKHLSSNSFTDAELEMMITGDNPQSNAYRQALAYRRGIPGLHRD